MSHPLTYLGPLGCLRPIECLPPLEMTATRPNARGITITGRRFTQQAPRSPREWRWSVPLSAPRSIRELEALEQGVYGPPPWRWYDPWAAALNMLPPNAAVPGLALDLEDVALLGEGTAATGGPVTLPDGTGRCVFYSITAVTGVAAPARCDELDPIAVLAERTYTASAYGVQLDADATGWWMSLVWTDIDGVEVARDEGDVVLSSDDELDRAIVTAAAPIDAAGVYVLVETDAPTVTGGAISNLTALQLTETDESIEWHPGIGVPHVSIPAGFASDLRRVPRSICDGAGGNLRSFEFTVYEVG